MPPQAGEEPEAREQTPPQEGVPPSPTLEVDELRTGTLENAEVAGTPGFKALETWREILKRPGDFLPSTEIAETEIRKDPMVQEMMAIVEGEGIEENVLYHAVLRLTLPGIPLEQINPIINNAAFVQIWQQLLVLRYLGFHKVLGFPFWSRLISKHMFENGPLIGTQEYPNGSVILSDMASSTTRTHEDDVEAAEEHTRRNFHIPYFWVLRYFPDVFFLKSAGDDMHAVSLESDAKVVEFAQAVATKIGKEGVHIGISQNGHVLVITPYGRVIILGKGWEEANAVQKPGTVQNVSLDRGAIHVHTAENRIINVEPNPELGKLPRPPAESQMQLFMGEAAHTALAELSKDPPRLAEVLREYTAHLYSTTDPAAFRLENPVQRDAIGVYIEAPTEASAPENWGRSFLKWEEDLERLAQKYHAKVLSPEMNSKSKTGFLVFGTLGRSSFKQEERAVRCMQELAMNHPDCKISGEKGTVQFSDTSKQPEYSKTFSSIVRMLKDKSPGLGPMRIGPTLGAALSAKGFGTEQVTFKALNLRGIGVQVILTGTLEDLKFPSEEKRYVRADEVTRFVEEIKALARTNRDCSLSIDITQTEAYGLGLTRILTEAARKLGELGDKKRIEVVPLQEDRERGDSYADVGRVLGTLFPRLEDFKFWMDKNEVNEDQKLLWRNLYKELTTPEEYNDTQILENPGVAENILTAIFKTIGRVGVVCEDMSRMDEMSKGFFKSIPVILITTGLPEEADHSLELGGVTLDEAMEIAKHNLEGKNPPEELRPYIERTLARGRDDLYNPTAIELLIKHLRSVNALSDRERGWELREEQVDAATVHATLDAFFDRLVATRIDEARGRSVPAINLLSTMVLLESPCPLEELKIAAPHYTQEAEDVLVECKILAPRTGDGDPVRFVAPFFAERARAQLQSNGIEELEARLRAGVDDGFRISHYLGVCQKIGMQLTPETSTLVAVHAKAALDRHDISEAMETCEGFLAMNSETIRENLRELGPTNIGNILEIHYTLIEARLMAGFSVEENLENLSKLIVSIDGEVREAGLCILIGNHETKHPSKVKRAEDLYSLDSTGRYLHLTAQTAFQDQDHKTFGDCIEALQQHYAGRHETDIDPVTKVRNKLAKARFHYRQAEALSRNPKTRDQAIESINSAIKELFEIDLEEIRSETRLVSKVVESRITAIGYKLTTPGLYEGTETALVDHINNILPEGEAPNPEVDESVNVLDTYINKVTCILEKSTREQGITEWILEAERYLARALDAAGRPDEAFACATRIFESANEHGYSQTALKGLTDMQNTIYYGECKPARAAGNYEEVVAACSKAEEHYKKARELTGKLTEEEERSQALSVLAIPITRFEWTIEQMEMLAENRELTQPNVLTPLIMRGDETIPIIDELYEKHVEKAHIWEGYIADKKKAFRTARAALLAA